MLAPVDYAIIAIYLALTVALGVACRGRQQDASDYFTARGQLRGKFGGLLVGFSIAATFFSGISFLAYPSVVYQHGLSIMVGLACFPIAWAVLHFWFLPRFFKISGGHPYDFIEAQFGVSVRLAASAMFVLLRVGWMAALIYAPTIMLLGAANLDDRWFWPLVLLIGLSSTLYTTAGGIRGVIVTDALQFVVIAGGVLFAIGFILVSLPVPLTQALAEYRQDPPLPFLNLSLSVTQPFTFWSVVIGFTIANMGSYLADQMSLQRYLASGDASAASRSFAINVISVSGVLVLLAALGFLLAAWYRHQVDPTLPESADKVLPHFIATRLPAGIAGLLFAAILAATMSSMTSGINALSGSLTNDFLARLGKPASGRQLLGFARSSSLIIGLAATLAAGLVGNLGTIFAIAQTLLGVFLGPLLACGVLSIARVPARPRMVIAGLVAGSLAGWLIAWSSAIALWVAPGAFLVAFLVPWLDRWLWARPPRRVLSVPSTPSP